jgi:ABC-2 type transport system ATP-binding protein
MLLKLEQVSLNYRNHQVLHALDFSMQAGEVVSVFGANGAGKSTLLKCILGLLDKHAQIKGEITINGLSLNANPQAARDCLAYVPEQPAVYGHLSGLENVRYFLGLAGISITEAEAGACLSQAGLQQEAWRQACRHYSKGMQQKIMLALAFARRAKLLLLDEPASGLDPIATDELNRLLFSCKEYGIGVLAVTHDIFSATQFSDRMLILRQGRLHHFANRNDALTFEDLRSLYRTGG